RCRRPVLPGVAPPGSIEPPAAPAAGAGGRPVAAPGCTCGPRRPRLEACGITARRRGSDGCRSVRRVQEAWSARGGGRGRGSRDAAPAARAAPSLRYLGHLSAPGLDVIGGGEPALPGNSIGHNGTAAFGLTIFPLDQ